MFKTEPTLKVILPKAFFNSGFFITSYSQGQDKRIFLTVTLETKEEGEEKKRSSLQNALREGAHKLMFYKGV